MFNALRYTQELERAGFSREQADTSMKVLIEVMNENFATKPDLLELEFRLKQDIAGVRHEVTELRYEVRALEPKLTIRLGAMLALAVGLTATLIKLL